MDLHKNARSCPASRAVLVERVMALGWTVKEASEDPWWPRLPAPVSDPTPLRAGFLGDRLPLRYLVEGDRAETYRKPSPVVSPRKLVRRSDV